MPLKLLLLPDERKLLTEPLSEPPEELPLPLMTLLLTNLLLIELILVKLEPLTTKVGFTV